MHYEEQQATRPSIQGVWSTAIRRIASQMGEAARNAYLRNLVPVDFDGCVFVVGTPNDFARRWLEERYAAMFANSLSDELRQSVTVKFVTVTPRSDTPSNPEPATADPVSPTKQAHRFAEFPSIDLNPRYVFDTFVVGRSNQLAHAAAQNVAKFPGTTYNPLFIYGGVGLGKTHLMHAIGYYVAQHKAHLRVVYISGEMFLNHVVTAIREGRTDAFRRAYRSVDLWLVDDIQFIASKEQSRTEAEFFHTFNALYETNKQIVISSDRPPRELQIMDDRLRSRFEMGLLTDIRVPDEETRVAILQRKAALDSAPVPDEVIRYIAQLVRSSVRALEGALTRVIASASLTGSPINIESAREWLADFMTRNDYHKVSPRQVRDIVARHFALKPDDLSGKRRDKSIVLPRQIAMYLARVLGDTSTVQIGAAFGGRDHSTVLHACTKIKQQMESDPDMATLIENIAADIQVQLSR